MALVKYPKVVVLVLNMNGAPFVAECIRSLIETKYGDFYVILFDNASVDGSHLLVQDIARAHPNLAVLRSGRPISVAKASNLAVRIVGQAVNYVAFVDNDAVVTEDWLSRLIEPYGGDEHLACCQSLLLRADNPKIVDGTGDFIDALGAPMSRDMGDSLSHVDLQNRAGGIFSARSAAMVVRRDVYELVGGMDEDFDVIFEDVDFGWRMRLAGFSVRLVPESVVLHKVSRTVGRLPQAHFTFQLAKNQLQMIVKNYAAKNVARYLPIRMTINLITVVLALVLWKPPVSRAIIRAIVWNMINMPRIMRKRAIVQHRIRQVEDSEIFPAYSVRLLSNPIKFWRQIKNGKHSLAGNG